MKRTKFVWIIIPLFTFILSSVKVSIAKTPGVNNTVIKLGASLPMSGPAAMWGSKIATGLRLAFRDINEKGGIHGRKIQLLVEDDGYRAAMQVTMVKKLLYRDNIFAIAQAINCRALFPLVQKEKIPFMTASAAISMAVPLKRYVFPIAAMGDIDGQLAVEYIIKDLKLKRPRVAIFYIDIEVGHDGLKSSREGLKTYGLKPVAEELHKPGSIDFMTQVINLKRIKPDYVILATVPRESASLIIQAKKMGLETNFFALGTTTDNTVIKLAGLDAKGLLGIMPFLSPSSGTPETERYLKLLTKYQPEKKPSLFHLIAYGGGRLFEEGLRRTGKNLTREGLVEAFETFKDLDIGVMVPVTYGKNDRTGVRSCYIFKANTEKQIFEVITKPRKVIKHK